MFEYRRNFFQNSDLQLSFLWSGEEENDMVAGTVGGGGGWWCWWWEGGEKGPKTSALKHTHLIGNSKILQSVILFSIFFLHKQAIHFYWIVTFTIFSNFFLSASVAVQR